MKKVVSSVFVLTTLVCSCKKELKKAAYVEYVQNTNNGLKKTIRVDNWEYTMQYKPEDYVLLMETKGAGSGDAIKIRRESLKRTAWFNISFKVVSGTASPLRYNLSSKEEYDQRYDHFLNKARQGIQLVYDHKDTLLPIAYLFENNFNLTPQETIVVGFELPKGNDRANKDMQLSYTDNVFKNGIIKASYKEEDLRNIPNLIF